MAMSANIKIERNYILSVSLYPQDVLHKSPMA